MKAATDSNHRESRVRAHGAGTSARRCRVSSLRGDQRTTGPGTVHAQPVDLVITDLEMPEMNGLDVILELTAPSWM